MVVIEDVNGEQLVVAHVQMSKSGFLPDSHSHSRLAPSMEFAAKTTNKPLTHRSKYVASWVQHPSYDDCLMS